MTILQCAEALRGFLQETKDDIHAHPELSYQEFRTTQLIREICTELGMRLIDTEMPTGVVAVLEGKRPGKNVAIRADIDALPRRTPIEGEYGNAFHGCGHDFHTTSLLGAAKILKEQDFDGSITFIFQPAEEATSGAREMKEHHLFEHLPHTIDMMFGFHNNPLLPSGVIGVREGGVMAAKTNFNLHIYGKMGHGGEPHKCIDPIVAAAAFVQGFQTIASRNTDPFSPIVCSICSIHGGETDNIVPDRVDLSGSIRALGDSVIRIAEEHTELLLEDICKAYGCGWELEYTEHNPTLFNTKEMTRLAHAAAESVVGAERVVSQQPTLASEDFSVLGFGIPYFFYMIGVGGAEGNAPGWHSAEFHTDDSVLPTAAAVLAQSALMALAQ